MKKIRLISSMLLLMISLSACTADKSTDDIYSKIHELYYDIASYSTECTITTYTKSSENPYDCTIDYDKENDSYTVASDDMKIHLTKDKAIITKGQNTIESPSIPEDMYIFINSFFKSYYESEDTVLSVSASNESKATLLECSAMNPTDYVSQMKLWLNSNTALPKKMQVFDSGGNMHTEIEFKSFSFN